MNRLSFFKILVQAFLLTLANLNAFLIPNP